MNYQSKIKSLLLFLCVYTNVILFSIQEDNSNNKSFSFGSLCKNPFAWATCGTIISLCALNYSRDSKLLANIGLGLTTVSILCAWKNSSIAKVPVQKPVSSTLLKLKTKFLKNDLDFDGIKEKNEEINRLKAENARLIAQVKQLDRTLQHGRMMNLNLYNFATSIVMSFGIK